MPTYVYETTDPATPARRFELKQSIHDQPLKVDPATGEPVKRIIAGGSNLLFTGRASAPAPKPRGGCGPGCGCHH